MRPADPLVTVAIPTRNRVAGLRAALESVLKQSYSNLEIIVSDNNTAGDTRALAEGRGDPRIKYFKHPRTLSMTDSWNFCLQKASGEFFLLLSDDDLLLPGAVAGLLAALAGGEVFSYGRAVFENEEGARLGVSAAAPASEPGQEFISKSFSGARQALPSFTLLRTASARTAGGYPETGNSTDLALRLTLAAAGSVACVGEPAGVYRIHPASLTGDVRGTMESYELFSRWCAAPGSPLLAWKDEARAYCAAALRERARACALRGDADSAGLLVEKAAGLSSARWSDTPSLLLLSSFPVRTLASWRRLVKGVPALEARVMPPGTPQPALSGAKLFFLPVLAIFIPGYFSTAGIFSFAPRFYAACNILSFCSACFFLVLMSGPGRFRPAWLVFSIMLVFGYAKFYVMALNPALPLQFFPEGAARFFSDSRLLLKAFFALTVSFSAFCAAAAAARKLLAGFIDGPLHEAPLPAPGYRLLAWRLLLFIPVLAVPVMFFIGRYKIGALGLPTVPLPFHLAGLFFYLHIITAPVLLLVMIYCAARGGSTALSRAGIALFLMWGLLDMALRNSRASIFMVPLFLFFLSLAGGLRLRRAEIATGALTLLLAFLLVPAATQYRYLRMGGLDALAAASSVSLFSGEALRAASKSLSFVFFRVPGIETLVPVLGFGAIPLGWASLRYLFTGDGLAGRLSYRLFSIPEGSHNTVATSFIGGAYLSGGYYGLVLFSACAGLAAVAGWRLIELAAKRTAPAAKAVFLMLIFWGMTEGISPMLVKQSAAALVTLALCELGLAAYFRKHPGDII